MAAVRSPPTLNSLRRPHRHRSHPLFKHFCGSLGLAYLPTESEVNELGEFREYGR
jgi:hypothetical protein